MPRFTLARKRRNEVCSTVKPDLPPPPPHLAPVGRNDRRRRRQLGRRRLALIAFFILVAVVVVVLAFTLPGTKQASGLTTTSTSRSGSLPTASSTTDSARTRPAGQSAGSTTTSSEGTAGGAVSYTATATSYKDATKSISITKASKGSGANKVTYFVIDVTLASAKDLRAGLADNAQGASLTSDIAAANKAIFAINGDYFRDRNDGIIIRNGVTYRDKPARRGLALFTDGTMKVYDETRTSAAQLLAEGVWNTYSFGPTLLTNGAVPVPDNLSTYEVVANPKYPIQGINPRTGVGFIGKNHFVFIDVDGRHPGYSTGVTLKEFAQMFKKLGCTTAYNLDGGASATVYFRGKVINQPKNHTAGPVQERTTSDILFVR
jgi:exopolysaccharide biosynthesis protein